MTGYINSVIFYLSILSKFTKAFRNTKNFKGGEKMTRRGQSTLEYVIILTAIIAAVIIAAKFLQNKVQSSSEHVATEMEAGVNKIDFGGSAGN